MKRVLLLWAQCPPFTKVHVTPHVAHSGPVYVSPRDPRVVAGMLLPGIHVALAEHKDALERIEREGLPV